MIYPSPKIEASYLYVDLGLEFAATIEVSDLVNVDVDAAGSVIGIERIGGPVDQETLLAVIAKIQQAAYQAGREDAAWEIERPGSILCDCSDYESPPTNPQTRASVDHHCDCGAVSAAATILGAFSKTNHGQQCFHGTEMDEFYQVNQPRTLLQGVGDNTEEQQREGAGES